MKEFRIFTVLKQASSTVSNIRSIKCRSSINSKKNSEFQMRFESIRTSGQITAGRWVQIPSGFQIFNKTGISVKLDLRKFCCWLIRYLTKYLLIKCMNYYNNNNILWNKNFKEIHTCWSRKSTSFPKGQLIPSDLICCCNDTNSCGCERNQKELGISVKYDFLEFWLSASANISMRRRRFQKLTGRKNKEQRERVRGAKDSFSPHTLPLLAHPLPTSKQFFAHPRFFARLFDLRLEKERKRLLRRLANVKCVIY